MALQRFLKHLLVENTAKPESYTSPRSGGGGRLRLPPRIRAFHAQRLLADLAQVKDEISQLTRQRQEKGIAERQGFLLQVESEPGFELALQSLDRKNDGIELVAVLPQKAPRIATIFVPHGKLQKLEKLVTDYRDIDKKKKNLKDAEPTTESLFLFPPKGGEDTQPANRTLVESIAADLADCHRIAVYPVGGWWKENSILQRWEWTARYSLLVTIRTPATDIYTPVSTLISTVTPILV